MNFMTSVQLKWELGIELAELVMSHSDMKRFVHSDSNSFDLVMIETFCQEYSVAIGHKFNAPVINLVPAMVWASVSKWLHVPATFSYIPDSCLKSAPDMSFVERLENTVAGAMQLYAANCWYLPRIKEIMDTHFAYSGWESRPQLERMLNDVSLTLVNWHHAIGVPRPYLPGIIEVGGMHIRQPNALPEVREANGVLMEGIRGYMPYDPDPRFRVLPMDEKLYGNIMGIRGFTPFVIHRCHKK